MRLSNAELMLLQIICEKGEVSGYEIDKLVEERGYREWADIGTTSIYTGLEKLRKKRFVESYLDIEKQGKGPLPRKFKLTKEGRDALRKETIKALSSSRERDRRFDLAIAAIPFLPPQEVIEALHEREEFLSKVAKNIEKKFESQGGESLPLNVKALFRHPLSFIRQEKEFMKVLVVELEREIKRAKH